MSSLKAAREGNSQAISEVLNYLLKLEVFSITQATIQNNYLNLFLESSQIPLSQSSLKNLYNALKKIDLKYIKYISIAAANPKKQQEIFKTCIDLTKDWETSKPAPSPWQKLTWPVWFPYPSSLLRMIVLIFWLAIVVRILGFWGVVIGGTVSDIFNHPKPLLQALGLSIFGSILLLSYSYFLVVENRSSPVKKSFPTARSLWEGTYAMIVLLLSLTITCLLIFPFIPWQDCYYNHVFSHHLVCRYHIQFYFKKFGFVSFLIWFSSGLYLYQIESVIRNQIPLTKIIRFLISVILSILISIVLNTTVKNWDNIYSVFSTFIESSPTVAILEIEEVSTYENTPEIEEMTETQENDPFNDALKFGMKAANLAQTAKSQQEWNRVSHSWEDAIQKLEEVPEFSSNFETAQQKIVEYQTNLNTSQKLADKNAKSNDLIPPDLNFKKGVEEASNAAFFVQTAKSKSEWELVATQWQNAIDYMKQVQPSDPNYKIAQDRVVLYQKNIEYARLAASQAEE